MVRTKRNKQAGFTLIEMLIVVLLLGILAMLIIPQISVSTEDAMENTLIWGIISIAKIPSSRTTMSI